MSDIKQCPKCGSKYEVTKFSIPMRDKDSIECDVCDNELLRWNGGVMYHAKLIKKEKINVKDKL